MLHRFIKFSSAFTKTLIYLKPKYALNQKTKYTDHVLDRKLWNILFFGSDEFALKCLQALHNFYNQKMFINQIEVVTAYRGKENAIIQYVKQHGISLHSWPPQINDKQFDIGIVVSFGHYIPSKIINLFPFGMINAHGSLLPKWRGAAPICHSLINGDTKTGVSIIKIMPKKFDIGPIIAQKEIEIYPDETYITLYNKLANLSANLLIEIIEKIPEILNKASQQTEDMATYAPKITQDMSFVKWDKMTAQNIYNLQRALTGIEPIRTYFNNQVIKLLGIKIMTIKAFKNDIQNKIPGLVLYNKTTKKLCIYCQQNSWITLEKVIIPGRRPLSATDFGTGFILNKKELCIFY